MTPTQTTAQPRPEVVIRDLRPRRSEWIERATSADHKSVALLYIATSLVFIALAATEFALMRVQLIVPENGLIQPEIFNRLMTASVSSFLYLGVIPLIMRADRLHRAAADRRSRRRPAAPQPALVLALLGRRGHLPGDLPLRRPRDRHDRPAAAVRGVLLPDAWRRCMDRRHRARLPRLHLLCDQHDRHPAADARAGARLAADADASPAPRRSSPTSC